MFIGLCYYIFILYLRIYIYIIHFVIYETPVFKKNSIRKQITQFINKQEIWVDTSPKHIHE